MTSQKRLLSKIAKEHLLFPTLKTRRSDSLDFRDVSVWAVEAALKAAFDAGKNSVDLQSLDLHELLAKRHQIAVIWSIEDVQEVRPDLSDEQSWQVLQNADRHHDANIGITWETLGCHAEMQFGVEPIHNKE